MRSHGALASSSSSILVLDSDSLSMKFHIDGSHLAVLFLLLLELLSTFVLLELRLSTCWAVDAYYNMTLVLRLHFKVAI